MGVAPQILEAQVMHRRLAPSRKEFRYRVFYLCLPLSALANRTLHQDLAIDRSGLVSFRTKDHGDRQGGDLTAWIRTVLEPYGLNGQVADVQLVCLPRILGYVFNPVSFWMCFDENDELRAVVSEVNNTFGETHSYICTHADGRPIQGSDWIETDKVFHVSPFLNRSGSYRFRFLRKRDRLAIRVDYYDEVGTLTLQTTLGGTLTPLNRGAVRRAFMRHPLVTLKVVVLIHWQALRLFLRRIKFQRKPEQTKIRVSGANPTKSAD